MLEPLVGGHMGDECRLTQIVGEHEYQGTRDYAAFLAVPAAIAFMHEHNWPTVRERCHELIRYARRAVTELTGLPSVVPDSHEWFAQMAVLPLPPCDRSALYSRLCEEYDVEIPICRWNGQQFARLSVQGYNTREDIDRLVHALAELLPQVSI
jgi:isopenicillin-N epimerase